MPDEAGSIEVTRREFFALAGAGASMLAAPISVGDAAVVDASRMEQAEPLPVPDWVNRVTRMSFLSPGEVEKAAKLGVQVMHTNVVWPYFPRRRDGGGLNANDAKNLKSLCDDCRRFKMRLVLGLPPFPSVAHALRHPDWRIHPDDSGSILKVAPREDNLGTRLGCNLGPWGDYLIDVCAELVEDFGLDGFSFDGNYHPPICYCPACKAAYKGDLDRALPAKVDLDDVAYREYLIWRGDRLIEHYAKMQRAIKKANPDAVLMSWTVNAGRFGHFLHSPRAMPTRLNHFFDLPMQEWWLDETNYGASIVPAFGAGYLRATVGDRPAAAEPYLMTRGNPYGTDSFPAFERRSRSALAITCGNVLALSMGWAGHDVGEDFRAVADLEPYMTQTRPLSWAGLLVSEQTRQFHAYKDIFDRFLPHPLGVFRTAAEEHLPLSLLNDWDMTADRLDPFAVLVLPNAAALSDAQVEAIKKYVHGGGGLVATGSTSLCDELGRRRGDFALADLLGASFLGVPGEPARRPELDENFARTLSEDYWRKRVGVAQLEWSEHPWTADPVLTSLVSNRSARFRGPLVSVTEPKSPAEVVMRFRPEGAPETPLPGAIVRTAGKGKVVYLPVGLDAALWSYAYPYQRRLLARAIEWAARTPAPITVSAPKCVLSTFFTQDSAAGRRTLLHFHNGVNTTANHGLPAADVPLREETIPIHDIEVTFHQKPPARLRCEPGNRPVEIRKAGDKTIAKLPPLDLHYVLVGEG